MKKNIKVGKIRFYFFLSLLITFTFNFVAISNSVNNLEGRFYKIKVLDKISSKKHW